MKQQIFNIKYFKSKMSSIRYLFLSIFIFIVSVFVLKKESKKIKYLFGKNDALLCDTTSIPSFSIFDVAKGLNGHETLFGNENRIILSVIDADNESIFVYDKLKNDYYFLGDSTNNLLPFSAADSVSFKALIKPNLKLYERWWGFIRPFRSEFWQKKSQVFTDYSLKMPSHNYAVVSDFRLSDNQAQLLKLGKSVAPLSQHQFGLANDIALKREKKYLQDFKTYKVMGDLAIENDLYWGGNFKGFVDLGHIQLFENSAKMLASIPALSFEFEPYKNVYLNRIDKMTKAGKEKSVEDSKELINILETLNEGKLCSCNLSIDVPEKYNVYESEVLKEINYSNVKDYLIRINLKNKILTIKSINGKVIKMPLGTWK
jgi:D-alanyl-D-alanine carboxypeptidase